MVKDPPDPITQDWNLFTASLRTLYGVHDAKNTAVVDIEALSKRDDMTVTQYIVEFQTHAPYTGWNDAALKAMFWKHLPERIKSAFLTIDKPATFDLMIEAVLNVDQNYWSAQAEKGIKPKLKSANENFNSQKKTDSANTNNHGNNLQNSNANQNQQRANQQPSANTQKNPSKSPQASGGKRGPISSKEKERCRREGLCFYCVSDEHFGIFCPFSLSNKGKNSGGHQQQNSTRTGGKQGQKPLAGIPLTGPPWPAARSTLLKPTRVTRETPW
jgi:hypothetical protein